MKKKQLILHIGIHKTGSTSIQHYLFESRRALAAQGYYYPVEGAYYYHGERSQSLLAHSILNNKPFYLGNLKFNKIICIGDFTRDISISEKQNVIISSEHFDNASSLDDFSAIYKLFAPLFETIKIIVYLRRQDLFLESTWTQWIKKGETDRRIDDFLESETVKNYYCFIDLISKVFGKLNIVVRPFERQQLFGNDVIVDFLNIIGLNSDIPVEKPGALNTTPPAEFVELLRILYQKFPKPEDRWELANFLGNMPFKWDRTRYSFLTTAARKRLLDSFRESNERVAMEFLGRKDGKLFLESEDIALPVFPGLAIDRMAEILATAVMRLTKTNSQLIAKLKSVGPSR